MMGERQAWPPALVSDAQYALRQVGQSRRRGRPEYSRVVVRARIAKVTAVCHAPDTADLFLGFESGEVICYRPSTGEMTPVAAAQCPILSLAATNDGDALVVLTLGKRGRSPVHKLCQGRDIHGSKLFLHSRRRTQPSLASIFAARTKLSWLGF